MDPETVNRRTVPTGGLRRLGRGAALAPLLLLLAPTAAWAHSDGAGGASLEEVLISGVVAAVFVAAVVAALVARRRGRLAALDRAAGFAERVGQLPGWAALPMGIAGASLMIAVLGFYWDVATHIDHGRDEGVFSNPSHWPILVGLVGLAVAGIVSIMLGDDRERPGGVELRPGWRVPVGGALLLLCGLVALAGFPIDDIWHRIFGQDVTLWSPPHIQMVAGASLCTIAMWVLFVEAERSRPGARFVGRGLRVQEVLLAGSVLVGMSTLQGEFDYGVPQFRLLFQPLLIAAAAGIALVPARLRLGPGGALKAVGFYLLLRGALTLIISGGLQHVTFHLPLYLGAALAVELVARRVPAHRQLTLGALAGLGIGTLGLATTAVWTHVWMPNPWTTALLPEAVLLGVPVAVAAGVVGGFLGRSLAHPEVPRQPVPKAVAPAVTIVLVAALAYPLPTTGVDGQAQIRLEPVADRDGWARATVELSPQDLGADAEWLQLIAWQGAEWSSDERTIVSHLEPEGDGVYRVPADVPIHGEWKSMIRVHDGRTQAAAPIFLPEDPAIPAEEVPAEPEMTRDFVPDHEILLREARPAPSWLTTVAYLTMALIFIGWVTAFARGSRRLRLAAEELAEEDLDAERAHLDPQGERTPADV